MKLIRVGAGVLNQTPLDWDGNRSRILEAIEEARSQAVSILCLPELCITGYGCEDAFHSVGTHEMALEVLQEITSATRDMIVSVGLPLFHRGALFNTACLIANGQILGFVGKQNLAGEGLHYEPRWFKPWPEGATVDIDIQGQTHPLGDLIFDCGGVQLGFEICEDAWVAHRPGRQLASEGVDVLLNPSASHFAFHKHQVRHRFVVDGSRAFCVAYVYTNLVGNEAGRAIYDGDAMIASCGQLLATGQRFSYRDVQVTSALVDIDAIQVARARSSSFQTTVRQQKPEVSHPFVYPQVELSRDRGAVPFEAADAHDHGAVDISWEHAERLKEEEFTRAVALGLFDYLRKSRSRGFVVSLSGGADSTGVALLCAAGLRFAEQEVGREAILRKLSYIPGLDQVPAGSSLVPLLLTTAYQSTRNSSTTTREAAAAVAAAVQADHLELDVDGLVQSYIGQVEAAIGRELTWQQDDVALQNIQARVRGPSVWMLANLRGALLLATSNRSEAAVGYATMDGDTCGGLSPIAGIDKAFLRRWLDWMRVDGPRELGPTPALELVTRQAPTAELRPLGSGQTDEADLMPYEVLDAIERAAIRDKRNPLECCQVLEQAFPQYTLADLGPWVRRFFLLWCRNQWKRERYAPSFHVDDENLDPKTWCRFPILSGGYERELRDLQDYLDRRSTRGPA
jgi:NAD+ synthase (glutamine-hydrolysing)